MTVSFSKREGYQSQPTDHFDFLPVSAILNLSATLEALGFSFTPCFFPLPNGLVI
ncbi:hypothetical protein ACTHGN_000380 [Pseudomonas putida]